MTVSRIDRTTKNASHIKLWIQLCDRAGTVSRQQEKLMNEQWAMASVLWHSINACHCLRKHGCDQSSRFVAHVGVSNICFVQLERTLNVVCDVLSSVALPVDDAVVLQSAESRCSLGEYVHVQKMSLNGHDFFTHTSR